MIFTISRASDQFRSADLPSIDFCPHKAAIWNKETKNWHINIKNIDQIRNLVGENIRLIIDESAHIEIDDIGDEGRARLISQKIVY